MFESFDCKLAKHLAGKHLPKVIIIIIVITIITMAIVVGSPKKSMNFKQATRSMGWLVK